MSSERARDYFEFLGDFGLTKHYGSLAATRELVDLCHIGGEHYVLDVGCGPGATPIYLAKTVGCRVMGVDLVDKMIDRAREWAVAEGLEDLAEFRVADALALPFADNAFDAVISESVNVFFDDKGPAMREYIRVTKPGGYVGMTEMTWLKPPTPEMEDAFRDMVYAQALDAAGWKDAMETAGLTDVVGGAHRMNISRESKGRLERYGRWRIVKAIPRILGIILRDRRARRFFKDGTGAVSKDLLDVVGYGVYAGRKE